MNNYPKDISTIVIDYVIFASKKQAKIYPIICKFNEQKIINDISNICIVYEATIELYYVYELMTAAFNEVRKKIGLGDLLFPPIIYHTKYSNNI
jgi:hypothetical protein